MQVCVWAREGQGKTHFWLTAPGPTVVFDFEHNLKETMRAFPERVGDVAHYSYMVPIVGSGEKATAKAISDKFRGDFDDVINAFSRERVRATIVIDSVTQLWELFRTAYTPMDESGKAQARDYGPAANRLAAIFQKGKAFGHRIIVTARAKDEWAADSNGKVGPTGKQIPDYYKEVAYASSIVVHITTDPTRSAGGHESNRVYTIRRCKVNESLEGMSMNELNWESLMNLVEAA